MDWRYVCASSIGTSHEKQELPCQDHARCTLVSGSEGQSVLIAVASDGAGSAKLSQFGSELTCATISKDVEQFVAENAVTSITRETALVWLQNVKDVIAALAASEGNISRDYACTLLLAVSDDSASCFMQVGDGAIVVTDGDESDWSWIFWPQKGEFANTTNFVTGENATDCMNFSSGSSVPVEIALFTDGIENLVLDFKAQTVFGPFFEKMFPAVRSLEQKGLDENLSGKLEAYLASPLICEKTDDDKSLILASRRQQKPLAENLVGVQQNSDAA